MDEMLEGFSTLCLFLFLPGIPLFLVLWRTGVGEWLLTIWRQRWFG
jgi:hypothetical protein